MFDVFTSIRNMSLTVVIWVFVTPSIAVAEFSMNFEPIDPSFGDNIYIDTRCNRPEGPNVGCTGTWANVGDPTPFLQELVTIDGVDYYHVIVGLPEDGFAQETFIKTRGAYEGGPGSASLGDGLCRNTPTTLDLSVCNAGDPLGRTNDNNFTGNGSGDPREMTMRQVMGGTWDNSAKTWECNPGDTFCYEFTKNDYLLKPKIEMTVKDPVEMMEANFQFDMSNSDYDTNNIAGMMINTVQFSGTNIDGSASFDFAKDGTSWSTLTGGLYTFTAPGPTNAVQEPYDYVDGNFKLDQDWWRYSNN